MPSLDCITCLFEPLGQTPFDSYPEGFEEIWGSLALIDEDSCSGTHEILILDSDDVQLETSCISARIGSTSTIAFYYPGISFNRRQRLSQDFGGPDCGFVAYDYQGTIHFFVRK